MRLLSAIGLLLVTTACAHYPAVEPSKGCVFLMRHLDAKSQTCVFVENCPGTKDLDHCVSDEALDAINRRQEPDPDFDRIPFGI